MTVVAPNETRQTTYSYDSLNRLSTLNNMEAQLGVEYTYNPNGKLASRTAGSVVCAYAYDSEQRLQSITVNNSKTRTYAYNNAQQISTIDDRLGAAYDLPGAWRGLCT